jgi:hypothetical protein
VAKERKETQIYVPVENYIGTARATLATLPKREVPKLYGEC